MDFYQHPESHYESIIDFTRLDASSEVKQEAFQAMKGMHGWCTENKAGKLIDIIDENKPRVVVEIGVFGGKSLVPMAFALRANGHGKIYGIDPWMNSESIKGMDGANKDWWYSIDHEAILSGLINDIKRFDLQNQVVLIKSTSQDAPPIPDIDILHIDGNHSEETSYFDVTKWVPCVRKGGTIIFDDITWGTTTKAVDWLDEHCIKQYEIVDPGVNVWGVWLKP